MYSLNKLCPLSLVSRQRRRQPERTRADCERVKGKQTKTIRMLEWLSSVSGVPQHCLVSTQPSLMAAVLEKLICCPWKGPGLGTRPDKVEHVSRLTCHSFSLGQRNNLSLTDASQKNYRLITFLRDVFHLTHPFSPLCDRVCHLQTEAMAEVSYIRDFCCCGVKSPWRNLQLIIIFILNN